MKVTQLVTKAPVCNQVIAMFVTREMMKKVVEASEFCEN